MAHHPEFFRQPTAPFTAQVLSAARRHAFEAQPHEACGLVRLGAYVPCDNVAENPESSFAIDDDLFAGAVLSGELEAVIHSHPGGGSWWPTAADMLSQMSADVPFAILVPGEQSAGLACHWGTPRPPLFDEAGQHQGRAFLHGVSDCYTLCQDYYAGVGIDLPDFARDWEWWVEPEKYGNLYLDNLAAQGFDIVTTDPRLVPGLARPGDAYLMRIASDVPNHAGIYLGGDLLLEHLPRNLSHREPMGRKLKRVTHWLRPGGLG